MHPYFKTLQATATASLDTGAAASGAIRWSDEAVVFGMTARVHFFDPREVDGRADFVARCLPMFRHARPRVLCTEQDRRNFRAGELVGQPDAVLLHADGLVSLEYKSGRRRDLDPARWQSQLDLPALLQTLSAAIAVAAETGRITAPVLRLPNAVLFLRPGEELVRLLSSAIPAARAYFNEPRQVSASQLASYCEAKVRARFAQIDASAEGRLRAGQERHARMLRPD